MKRLFFVLLCFLSTPVLGLASASADYDFNDPVIQSYRDLFEQGRAPVSAELNLGAERVWLCQLAPMPHTNYGGPFANAIYTRFSVSPFGRTFQLNGHIAVGPADRSGASTHGPKTLAYNKARELVGLGPNSDVFTVRYVESAVQGQGDLIIEISRELKDAPRTPYDPPSPYVQLPASANSKLTVMGYVHCPGDQIQIEKVR